ncbi:hypothetical protein MLD38_012340 [Melastoma candidum]|uniref:Uncharacterized protein n=1 Tax=Melastoma candidum TaxID=119954 RepID=A0ACB9R733_9MYRT|nr:hypothetical protein MLD38_012340 [Melastoma candidum]
MADPKSHAESVVGNGCRGRRDEGEEEEDEEEFGSLKYLEFVHAAGVYVVFCFFGLYEFAKANSGPLLPGVQSVEDTVRAVVRPLYDKFRRVPIEALRFVDNKVDGYVSELEGLVPLTVKRALSLVRAAASELHEAGLVGTTKVVIRSMYHDYEPRAREVFVKYEPLAGHYVEQACRRLSMLPLFPQAAMLVGPTAVHWAEKYNSAVRYGTDREYIVTEFLPLIPTEKMAKMFEEEEEEEPEQEHMPVVATDQTAKLFDEQESMPMAANGGNTNCYSGIGFADK